MSWESLSGHHVVDSTVPRHAAVLRLELTDPTVSGIEVPTRSRKAAMDLLHTLIGLLGGGVRKPEANSSPPQRAT
jgi:hypothetical protein